MSMCAKKYIYIKKKLVIKELLYLIITQKSCKSSCLWTQFRKHFGLTQALVSMPFPANPLFQPSLLDTAFQTWFGKGLHCIRNLFINGPLAVCLSYIVLSWIWKATLLIIWENDGENMELPEEPWQKVIKRIHTSSICVRHRLYPVQDIPLSAFFSRARLAQICAGTDPDCIRCHQVPCHCGTYCMGIGNVTNQRCKFFAFIYVKFCVFAYFVFGFIGCLFVFLVSQLTFFFYEYAVLKT